MAIPIRPPLRWQKICSRIKQLYTAIFCLHFINKIFCTHLKTSETFVVILNGSDKKGICIGQNCIAPFAAKQLFNTIGLQNTNAKTLIGKAMHSKNDMLLVKK
jgi:hypothetical protein